MRHIINKAAILFFGDKPYWFISIYLCNTISGCYPISLNVYIYNFFTSGLINDVMLKDKYFTVWIFFGLLINIFLSLCNPQSFPPAILGQQLPTVTSSLFFSFFCNCVEAVTLCVLSSSLQRYGKKELRGKKSPVLYPLSPPPLPLHPLFPQICSGGGPWF